MYNPSPPAGNVSPEAWDQYLQTIQQAITATSGWEQKKLEAQYADAAKGRENAYKIAQLSAATSRYGTDAARETAMAQLKQQAKQFEQTHALNIATAATDFLSTPDRWHQASDFISMVNRAGAGQGPAPYGANGTPRPKTMADWNQLYTGGGSPAGPAAPVPAPGGGGIYDSGPNASAASASSGGGGSSAAQTDPRQQAVQQIFKAIPPSGGQGLESIQYAALDAARALYESNLRPGTLQKMRPDQLAMLGSAGRRLGYSVPDWTSQQMRNSPGQQSVRAA